jgi:autotransporter-associated beta strand protein
LTLKGVTGAESQSFAGTTIAGSAAINLTLNTATTLTANLGAVTQTTGGTLNFTNSLSTTSTGVIATAAGTSNQNNILGTWATQGATTTLTYLTVNGSNQIVNYTGGTTAATAAALTDTTGSVNYNLSAITGTPAAGFSANTVRYTGAAGTLAPGVGFSANGIMNAGTGLLTIGTNAITIGANKELVIESNAQGVTISSPIGNNTGGTSALTYASVGSGTLTLSGLNQYTGATTINSGTLALGLANAINASSAVTINGGTLGESTFADTVAAVHLTSGSITGTGTLTSTSAFDVQSGTINAVLGGTAGMIKTTAGTVALTPAVGVSETFTGGVIIKAGTLTAGTGGSTDVLGSNTITLGDTSGSADARFVYAGTATTYANPIVLASGTTGLLSIGTTNATTVTSFTGGITGTNNLTVSGSTLTVAATFSSVNNTGTFTSALSSAGSTVVTTLGTNVTGLIEAGAGALTVTNAITPSSTFNTLTNVGTGLLTLTGGVGSGTANLVFNANNTGGITSTAGIGSTGTITNSGTGAGTVTITGAIGANVTNVLENSATSTLTLSSAANAYTGTTTVTQGTLSFAGTPVTGTTSGLGNSSTPIVLGGPTTTGDLVYTGTTAVTMTRNLTVMAGGGEIDANGTGGVLTILPGAAIAPGGPITFGGSVGETVGSATTTGFALITGNNALNKTGAGTLTLSTLGGGTNTVLTSTSTAPVNVQAGTMAIATTNLQTNNILGAGVITILPTGVLTFSYGGNTTSTLANNIVIGPGSGTATLQTTSGAITDSTGTVSFAATSTAATIFKLVNTNGTAATLALGGAISGTGTIQLDPTAAGAPITLSGVLGETGTISNVGSSTSTATISGTVGTGVTAITQAGANPFTVTSAITLNATLNSFTSTGAGLFTLGAISGPQNLSFNANSSGAITVSGAITITGTGTNNGVISNNGTGFGTVTITGTTLGAGVASVVENSATSPLVITGAVPSSVTVTDTAGEAFFSTPASLQGSNVVINGILGLAYGSSTQFQQSDVVTVLGIPNATYPHLSFASSGASIGLDTTTASASFTGVVANPAGTTSFGFVKLGTNTLTLGNANTYSGPTWVQNGTLSVASLDYVAAGSYANHGSGSSLGAPGSVANGTISLGNGSTTGVLSYTGPGETTDRVINLAGTTGGGTLDQSGSGPLVFTSNVAFTGVGIKTVTLSGSTSAAGTITGSFVGGVNGAAAGAVTIAKIGTGTWNLTGAGNTAQNVTISGGTLNFGANGILLNDAGGGFIQASANAVVQGKLQLGGVPTGVNNGPDIGAASGVTLDLTGATLTDDSTVSQTYVDFYGGSATGTTLLSNTNTYSTISDISAGTLVVSSINSVTTNGTTGAVHSAASSLGSPSSITNGTLNFTTTLGAALKYIGTGETTDRAMVFTGTTAGMTTTLDQSGTGVLKFLGALTASGAATHILNLQGSTAGTGIMAGAISDNSTTNATSITKNGTGTWTLSGANTYTGTTTVTGGNLVLANSGALSNSHITVNSGGTLSVTGGAYTAGNVATAAAGATLTLNSGSTLNLADGTVGNFNVVQNSTFAPTAATFAGASLNFDIAASTADEVNVALNGTAGTGLAASSGTNVVSVSPISGVTSLGPQYTLIQAAGTLSAANFTLASPNLVIGATTYNLSLALSGTNLVLNVTSGSPTSTPANAYWAGNQGASWATITGTSNTNWAASANGTPDTFALPGIGTNVTFTANTAANLNTTLDQNFEINSLSFTGGATSNTAGTTIASGSSGPFTLRLDAGATNGNTAGNGITVQAGSGANTISSNVALGAAQTWTNNGSNPLTISGVISEVTAGTSLTTAGTGTIVLSNTANTYSGATTIGAGSILSVPSIANGLSPSSIGQSSNAAANLVFAGSGTLQYTGPGATSDRNFTINAGITATFDVAGTASLSLAGATGTASTGALTKVDTGALTLTGAQTYTGNTVVNGGSLTIAGSLTGNGTTTGGSTLLVANTGGTAVVNIAGNVNTYYGYSGANVPGAVAVYNQSAGTFNSTTNSTTEQTNYVAGNGGYGYFNMTGGTFNSTERFTIATSATTTNPGAVGVMYVGGTATFNSNTEYMLVSYLDANDIGSLTVGPGGTVHHDSAADPLAVYWTTTGETGMINVAGGLLTTNSGHGIYFGDSGTSGGNLGIVNFDAGTYQTNVAITNTSNTSAATASNYINAAGGTIKTTGAVTGILPTNNTGSTLVTTIYGPVNNSAATGDATQNFTGGLKIDTGTFASTLTQTLNGASGSGVYAANLSVTGGTGYVGAPAVTFTGGTLAANGAPASGYALINAGGAITGVVITAPGEYTVAPTVTLSGGGGTGASVVITSLTTNSNTGGLTKIGTGTLTVTGTNTFAGGIDIQGGILSVATLTNGGVAGPLGQSSNAASNLLLDGGILQYTGTVAATTDRNFTLNAASGGFDASGTSAGTLTLSSANAMTVTGGLGSATLTLQGSGTGATGAGSIGTLIADGSGTSVGLTKLGTGTWTIANSANSYSGPTTVGGGTLVISTIAAGGNASSIGASSNAAANLVLSGGALQNVGAGGISDRSLTFGNATTASGGAIDNEGTGPLVFNGTMTGANTAAGTQTLTLTAAAGSGNNVAPAVVDSSATALTALTKAGAGTWALNGTSNYSGATTLSGGTLQYAGSLTGTTPFTIAPATFLQFRENGAGSSGTISHTSNSITVSAAGTVTIDTGNNGSNTANTVAFGTLSSGPSTSTNAVVYDFLGENGYAQSYSSLLLPGSTGQNTTLVPTTTSVTITGAVTNQITTATAHYDTLFLDGTSTGNAVNGVISDSSVYASVGNGDTRITKQNTSTWTLGGANTYHGPTAINAGTLILSGSIGNASSFAGGTAVTVAAGAVLNEAGTGGILGTSSIVSSGTVSLAGANSYTGVTTITAGSLALTGSVGNTAISAAASATFSPLAGSGTVSAGTTGAGTAGATLNVAANGTINMVDGAIGIFDLNTNNSFATAALTLASANLNLELAGSGADQIVVAGNAVASAITGVNTVNITALGASLTAGTYPILTAPGVAAGNTLFKFSNGTTAESVTVGASSYILGLTSIAGVEELSVSPGSTNLTWTGLANGTGSINSNWASGGGNNNFANSTPAVQDYTDGSAVTFGDSNAISGGNVTNATVTIAASGVNPSAVVVNNTLVTPYTFQNAAGTIGIAGPTGLTKTGTGTLILSGANTYTGPTAINGGVVQVNAAETGTTSGPLGATTGGGAISFGGGTLQYTATDTADYSARFSNAGGNLISIDTNGQSVTFATALTSAGGTLTKLGSGTLTLSAVNTYSGSTTINAGMLTITNANLASGALASPTITVNAGATLNLTNNDTLGYTAGRNALFINDGTVQNNVTADRDTLTNLVTMTGGFLSGTATGNGVSGAFSLQGGLAATSDASGNPATVSAIISTQNPITFTVTRGASVTGVNPDLLVSGVIEPYATTGTNGITITGNGITTLSASNTFLNGTVVTGGSTLIIGKTNTLPTGQPLTMGDGTTANVATINLTNFSQTVAAFNVKTNSATAGATADTLNIAAGQTLTTTGAVTVGVGAATTNYTNLTATGGGTWNVGSSPTPTNAAMQLGVNLTTNISNGGTLDLTGLSSFNAYLGTGTLQVGETANAGGTGTAGWTVKLAPNSTINAATISSDSVDGSNTNAFVEAIVLGTGTNIFNANTILIGSSANRASGTLGFATGTGTLKVRNEAGTGAAVMDVSYGAATTGFASTATVVDLTGHNADLLLSALNIGGRTTMASGNSTGVMKFDTGTLNTTGLTIGLRNGTTAAGNATGDLQLSGGTITIGATGALLASNPSTFAGNTANGSIELSGAAAATVGATSNVSITLGNATTVGEVATASLSIAGTSSLTLAGDLIKGTGAGSATVASTLTLNGGTLNMGGYTIGSGGLANGLAINTLNFQAGTLENVAQINNGAGLTKTTAGTLLVAGTNLYTGGTNIQAGTLQNGATNAVPSSSVVTIGSSGIAATYDLDGFSSQVAGLVTAGTAASQTVTNSGAAPATLTVSNASPNIFGGVISDGSTSQTSVVMAGSSTLTLTGGNTYSGTTGVSNAGTLYLNGATGGTAGTGQGNYTIASAATLRGAAAAIYLASGKSIAVNGGTLALGDPASGAGNLTVNGAGSNGITFSSSANLAAPIGSPQLVLNGVSLTLPDATGTPSSSANPGNTFVAPSGTTTGTLALNTGTVVSGAVGLTTVFDNVVLNGQPLTGGTWQPGVLNGPATDVGYTYLAGTNAVMYDETTGTISAVPEPGTLSLAGIGALGLLARRRRRIVKRK